MSTRGAFIVLEGADGGGKSTQARLLASDLDALLTREPGGTPIGEQLRALWLDPGSADMDDRTEALVLAAARAQHVAQVIEPALAAGRDVVCDRYVHSSIAYQGAGRQLGVQAVTAVNRFAIGDLWPDLVIQLEVPASVASARLGDELDRVEGAGAAFHARVRAAYVEMAAAADPGTWVVVDGTGSIEAVAAAVRSAVRDRFGR